jgi:hypothetical protein
MRYAWVLLVPLDVLSTTGCAVTGKWSAATVEPEAARKDFEYASLALQEDGSSYAESQKSGVHTTSSAYSFKDGTRRS